MLEAAPERPSVLMEHFFHFGPPRPRLAALERHLHRLHDVPPLAHAGRPRQPRHAGFVLRRRPRVFEVGEELAAEVVDRVVANAGLADRLLDLRPDRHVVALVLVELLGAQAEELAEALGHRAPTTRWRWRPSLSMPSSTTSPAFRKTGGSMPSPTPAGVPVEITSPGSRVMHWLR